MKMTAQIVADLASLAIVFLLGSLFNTVFWQAGYHAKALFGPKPLPYLTEFLIVHNHLPLQLALLPWLWLVGAPLLTLRNARNYWDASAFVLRFIAFTACEGLWLILCLLFLLLPFVGYYAVLRSNEQSTVEWIVRGLVWLVTVVIIVGAGYRAKQLCKKS